MIFLQRVKKLTEGEPLKLILLFSLPLMLGNVFNQLYYVIDAAIVGKFVGTDALSAVGATDWLNYLFTSIVLLFPQGFGILIAKAFGKKDQKTLKLAIQNSIFLSIIIAILVVLIGELSLRHFLVMMHTPDEILDLAVLYLKIIIYGVPLNMLFQINASILRSFGDSKSPLIAMIVAALLNIGLDLLFVITFNMGIAGAAIATIISQGVSGLVVLFFVIKHKLVSLKGFRIDLKIIKELVILALPVAMQGVIISIGGLFVQNVINSFGKIFIAGCTASNKLYGMLEICATSFGLAMTTYVSQNYGAKNFKRILEGVNKGAILAVFMSIFISVAVIFLGDYLIGFFVKEGEANRVEVINVGYDYIKVMAYALSTLYLLYTYRSALQGLGNTVIPMLSGVVELVMRITFAYTLPSVLAELGVYLTEVFAWIGACMLLIPSFYIVYQRKKHFVEYELASFNG